MKRTQHTLLIAFAVTLLLGASYLYFSNGLSSEAADSSSSLASSNGAAASAAGSDEVNLETAFLSQLQSLTTIKIDTSLLSDPLFQGLRDNNVTLPPVVSGRPNPFAPIDANAITNQTLSPVVTNTPSQITNTSAVFKGTVNSVAIPTSAYFEYGSTPSLGQTTQSVSQSLVSTFVTKVTGLTSGTTYFYRAVAKINGVLSYGEVTSFNTN
jgi:hypothetical protein